MERSIHYQPREFKVICTCHGLAPGWALRKTFTLTFPVGGPDRVRVHTGHHVGSWKRWPGDYRGWKGQVTYHVMS